MLGAKIARTTVLAVVGAVLACGCRPAWDSASRKVAFPFLDGERSGIAVYDVEFNKVRRVFEEAGGKLSTAYCLWAPDGKSILALAPAEGESARVLKMGAVDGKAETLTTIKDLVISHKDAGVEFVTPTPPMLSGAGLLWIGPLDRQNEAAASFLRLNLKDGKGEEFFKEASWHPMLFDFGKRGCFYVNGVQDEAGDKRYEIGTFDPETGKHMASGKLEEPVKAEFVPYLAAELDGKRLAKVVFLGNPGNKTAGQQVGFILRLFGEDGKTLKNIPLTCGNKFMAGSLAWAGDFVWIAAGVGGDDAKLGKGSGLLRVNVNSGQLKFFLLSKSDIAFGALQPAVSPDGKKLAVIGSLAKSRGEGEGKKARTIALVMFDLTAPDKEPAEIELPSE
jgi:hypothetical protein